MPDIERLNLSLCITIFLWYGFFRRNISEAYEILEGVVLDNNLEGLNEYLEHDIF